MSWLASLVVGGPLLALLAAPSAPQGTRFVTIGHFRDLVTDFPEVLEAVAEAINRENPDYIFLLGDFIGEGAPEEWEAFDRFMGALRAPVFSSPGNHEFNATEEYRKRFGYLYNTLITKDANFVLINSSDDLPVIRNYLDHKWHELDNERPTILLSHFILWAAIADTGKVWEKTYGPEEILPYLSGRVDYILSGDNPHPAGGTYEPARFDEMVMHPVGIGFAGTSDPVVFFVGEIESGGILNMTPRFIELSPDHRWHTVDRADLNYAKTFAAKQQSPTPLTLRQRVVRRLTNTVAQQTAVLVSLFWLAAGLLFFRRMKRSSR